MVDERRAPADVTGSFLYDQRRHELTFRAGPVFTNLLLADEINRTPPKTQAALLEAMQEKQVSVEGATYRLERPFHVLATANPIEYEGTYPLPEAQLDRLLLRVSFGYPSPDEEWAAPYLLHSLAALATALPYDAVVAPAALVRWLVRTLAVVVVSSLLCVALLVAVGRVAGGARLVATLVGLTAATAIVALLPAAVRR